MPARWPPTSKFHVFDGLEKIENPENLAVSHSVGIVDRLSSARLNFDTWTAFLRPHPSCHRHACLVLTM